MFVKRNHSAISENKSLLWKRFLNGDNESIAILYKQMLPKLIFIAYRYLKDKEKAKDVVSDVFEKLITLNSSERNEKLPKPDEKLDSFFNVIVKNQSINTIKTEHNRARILNEVSINSIQGADADELQEDDLKIMMAVLPQRQSEILQLKLNGFKNSEISTKLDISEQTVKNTLVTAKKKIKEIYHTFAE